MRSIRTVLALLALLASGAAGCVRPPADGGVETAPSVTPAAAEPSPAADETRQGAIERPTRAPLRVPADAVVAYLSDGTLWALVGDDSPRRLLDGGGLSTPRISPDGEWVAVRRGDSLWIVAPGTGEARELVPNDALVADVPLDDARDGVVSVALEGVSWHPRGGKLGFSTRVDYTPPEGMGYSEHRDDLWLVTLQGERRQVLPAGQGGHPFFSPDGRHVALTRLETRRPPQAVVAVAEADGDDPRVLLTHAAMGSGSEWLPYAAAQWTADGQTLLVAVPEPAEGNAGWGLLRGPLTLFSLALDAPPGATPTPLASLGAGSVYRGLPGTGNYGAAWSPDGAKVAALGPLSAATPGPTAYPPPPPSPLELPPRPLLILSTGDGSTLATLEPAAGQVGLVAWSPDGTRLAYRPARRSDPLDEREPQPIYIGAIASGLTPLPESAALHSVRWLDDRRLIGREDDRLVLRDTTGRSHLLADGVAAYDAWHP